MKMVKISFMAVIALLSILFAQVSDHEILSGFKKGHQELFDSLRSAKSLEKCDLLEQKISSFKAQYSKHQNLINEAVNPDNFESFVTKLDNQLLIAKDRNKLSVDLAVSNQQNDSLKQEVTTLSGKIQQLSDENSGFLKEIKSLKIIIKKDKETIAKMSQLIDKLKANIEARDNLVMSMLDSLFIEFEKPNLSDVEKSNLQFAVNNRDFLRTVMGAISDNEKFIESAELNAQDVLFIKEEHKKMSSLWNKISPSIGELYPDEATKVQSIGLVNNKLSAWKLKIEEKIWQSIYASFTKHNLNVTPFNSGSEFYTNVMAFVDNEMVNLNKERYQLFNDSVWVGVKEMWLPVVMSDNSITEQQRIEIEDKVDLWGQNFTSPWIKWIVIIISVVAVAVVIVIIKGKKRAKTVSPTKDSSVI